MEKSIDKKRKENPSFLWNVVDFSHKKNEYTLKNSVTGEIRTITHQRMQELLEEQGVIRK
jgi:hypothetical protein